VGRGNRPYVHSRGPLTEKKSFWGWRGPWRLWGRGRLPSYPPLDGPVPIDREAGPINVNYRALYYKMPRGRQTKRSCESGIFTVFGVPRQRVLLALSQYHTQLISVSSQPIRRLTCKVDLISTSKTMDTK